jgi:hypothetical protein
MYQNYVKCFFLSEMEGQGMKLFLCKTTHAINSFDIFNKLMSIFQKILWHIDPLLGNDRETMRQQPLLGSGARNNGSIVGSGVSSVGPLRGYMTRPSSVQLVSAVQLSTVQ